MGPGGLARFIAFGIAIAMPAVASAATVGSNLQTASQTDGTCTSGFGTATCTIWSSPYTLFLPTTGTVTAVRVRGGNPGRMQVVVFRGQ
jgi:hypothetical protein